MTLDIRAKVFCNKGPVISGGFSDDHVQGTGLIRTRGDIVLEGLVTLRPGDKIQIGYERLGALSVCLGHCGCLAALPIRLSVSPASALDAS